MVRNKNSRSLKKGVSREAIVADYMAGRTYREMSAKYGVAASNITFHLRKAGVIGTRTEGRRYTTGKGMAGWTATNGAGSLLVKDAMRLKAIKMALQAPKVVKVIYETARQLGPIYGITGPRSEVETAKILEKL